MLDSITIQNFKAIQGEPLELKNLAPINYLVGPNGCGKSSVLESIHLFWFVVNNSLKNKGCFETFQKIERFFGMHKLSSLIQINTHKLNIGGGFNTPYSDTDPFNEWFYTKKENIENIEKIRKDFSFEKVELSYLTHNLKWLNSSMFNHFLEKQDLYGKISKCTGFANGKSRKFTKIKFIGKNYRKYLFESYFNQLRIHFYLFGLGVSGEGSDVKSSIENYFFYLRENSILIEKFVRIRDKFKLINFDEKKVIDGNSFYFSKDHYSAGELRLYELLLSCFLFPKNSQHFNKIILLEEPEIGLHPNWQKRLPSLLEEINKEIPNLQFLISTHSPFIINAAIELENQKVYHIQKGKCLNPEGLDKKKLKDISSIHTNLGMFPSDLLFSNKMIWVEGPTDAIYLEFWLKKYAEEKKLKVPKKGIDYEFSTFGGASAENFYLLEDDYEYNPSKEKDPKSNKIFDMLKIHPYSFILIDNDGGKLENGKISDGKSTFEKFKQRVVDSEISYWYEKDPNIFTIECYRKDVSDKNQIPKNKKNFAIKYIENTEDKKFSEYAKPEAENMIKKIYNFIIQK